MMKKVLLALFAFPVFAKAQNADAKFSISGSVKGLADKSIVFLVDGNKTTDTIAKGVVKEGGFKLAAHVSEPNFYLINFGSAANKLPLFIGNDVVKISGDISDLKNLSVTGSPSHNDFTEFQRIFNPLMTQLNTVGQMINSQQYIAKNDSLMTVYKSISNSVLEEEGKFVENRKSSYVSPFVLIVLAQLSDNATTEKRFAMLTSEVQNGFFGRYLQQQIETAKIGEVGSDEIDFAQNDTSGKPVQLSSFKGKYVLVDFWASWCGPCRKENPNVVAAYGKFKNKNFTVLGVSLDKAKGPWIQAIKDDGLTWTHVSDLKFWNNEVAMKYHIQQIPQNMLIGPDGKIVAKNLRGPDLESKLCELLGCN